MRCSSRIIYSSFSKSLIDGIYRNTRSHLAGIMATHAIGQKEQHAVFTQIRDLVELSMRIRIGNIGNESIVILVALLWGIGVVFASSIGTCSKPVFNVYLSHFTLSVTVVFLILIDVDKPVDGSRRFRTFLVGFW